MRSFTEQMKRFMKSKFFIILASVAVFLTVLPSTLAVMGRQDLIRSGVNLIATPFKAAAKWCGDSLDGFGKYFTEYDRLKAENEELRQLLEAEKNKNDLYEIATEENQWLREFLMYGSKEPKLTFVDAVAVGRESGDYVTSFTLNKGSLHGVDVGMAVIEKNGLVGYVSEVGVSYCKITTVVSDGAAVGIICPRSGAAGTLEGDYSYISTGLCKVTFPSHDADVSEGDIIYTSGVGSVYPYGISVGRVESVEKDRYTRKTIASVRLSTDLTSINRVMIITEISSEILGGVGDEQ